MYHHPSYDTVPGSTAESSHRADLANRLMAARTTAGKLKCEIDTLDKRLNVLESSRGMNGAPPSAEEVDASRRWREAKKELSSALLRCADLQHDLDAR